MNEGYTLPRCPFPSNVFLAFLTQSELVKHKFGIASKLCELGDGPLSSCMIYVGLGLAIMIAFIGSKPSLVKRFLNRLPKRLRFGTSSMDYFD